MFACHLCSKSFAKKAGLTEHCKGKKHLENISAPEKRKEIEALESAALAQRHKLSSDATSKFEAMRAAQDANEARRMLCLKRTRTEVLAHPTLPRTTRSSTSLCCLASDCPAAPPRAASPPTAPRCCRSCLTFLLIFTQECSLRHLSYCTVS